MGKRTFSLRTFKPRMFFQRTLAGGAAENEIYLLSLSLSNNIANIGIAIGQFNASVFARTIMPSLNI